MIQTYKKSQKPVKVSRSRKPKKESSTSEVGVITESESGIPSDKQKRGRKPKQQIMMLNQDEDDSKPEEIDTDELARLISEIELEDTVVSKSEPELENNFVSIADELESEEMVDENKTVEVSVPAAPLEKTPVLVQKKVRAPKAEKSDKEKSDKEKSDKEKSDKEKPDKEKSEKEKPDKEKSDKEKPAKKPRVKKTVEVVEVVVNENP
jgi:hypothetical protein